MGLFGNSKVKYVRTDIKPVPTDPSSHWVYKIYRTSSKQEAVDFLKKKSVTSGLKYLIVEFPGGSMGRDINGIYQES